MSNGKEYISRDKVLEFLENSLKYTENELPFTHVDFKKGCIAAIKDDIGNISHIPTEDVVPRSEIEQKEDYIKNLRKSLNFYKNKYKAVEHQLRGIIKNQDQDKQLLVNEIEGLKKENKILSASNKTLAFSKGRIEAELNKAKQEVVREIFEDIYDLSRHSRKDLRITYADFDELRKKYIGEGR